MIAVLSNVMEVRIKAGIFRTSLSMAIGGFRREVAAHAGNTPKRVEVCNCPAPYTGSSCHLCDSGMYHKDGWGCATCECNNYSHTCDSFTGACENCAYDTACHHCDCCAEGFYGAPAGAPNPCRPCPCGGRAATCTTTESGGFGACVGCVEGYQGRYCERCVDGYYGDPGRGVPCRKCDCSGNIDINETGKCHNVTGECYNCLHHTTGIHCDICERGYHGDATTQDCQQCSCNLIGAKDNICDPVSGFCLCKDNVEGVSCDRCAPETYGLSWGTGCRHCDCDTSGTTFGSSSCDARSGECSCRSDRQYRRCDGCANGYYLNHDHCFSCRCPSSRSANYSCNGITGQCFCTKQYTGLRCDIAACRRGPWSDWTPCDKPCGNGTQTRTRRVSDPDHVPEGFPVESCPPSETETQSCNTAPCTESLEVECGVVVVGEPLYYGNCRTRRHYPIKRCQGGCLHGDIDCCQPFLLTQKRYTLYCSDGSRITHTFDTVQQCGCLAC